MALQPFRCISQACIAAAGNNNGTEYHSEPKGQAPELKVLPADPCPNCGNDGPRRMLRLQLIHLLVEAPAGTKADHKGTHDDFNFACDRARASKAPVRQATRLRAAVTCPDCQAAIKAMAASTNDD